MIVMLMLMLMLFLIFNVIPAYILKCGVRLVLGKFPPENSHPENSHPFH